MLIKMQTFGKVIWIYILNRHLMELAYLPNMLWRALTESEMRLKHI